jgi:hypothetical protein
MLVLTGDVSRCAERPDWPDGEEVRVLNRDVNLGAGITDCLLEGAVFIQQEFWRVTACTINQCVDQPAYPQHPHG